jgi:glucuronosyltransferase
MTHGGLLSCTESVHFGVPLVVIPVFGDQPLNAKQVEGRGQGIILKLDNITEDSVEWAMNEMMTNYK